ncbi:MAG: hypothetical protein LBN26_00520 [Christensenellaceae bacterium]|nr:hypothetical protein [Christensenellaceae bacterium]
MFKAVYNGFLWALLLAMLCFSNTWLQMRINTGYVCFGLVVLLSIALHIVRRKHSKLCNWAFTLCNLAVCAGIALAVFGWRRLQVVPAALLREGLRQPRLPFATINGALLIWLIAGFVGIAVWDGQRNK